MSDRKVVKLVPAVPAHEKEFVVGQNCDRCGKDIPPPGSYRRRDFRLEFLEGDSFPEGTTLEGWELPDCCDECLAVLKALLLANGFKVVDAKRDY